MLSIILVLLLFNIWGFIDFYHDKIDTKSYLFRKFNFDKEKNFPSVISGLLHLSASIFLFYIASIKLKINKRKYFWISLGLVFLFISIDEIGRIHENIKIPDNNLIPKNGIFHYAWVIPYGIATLILGLLYIKPLFQLPKRTYSNFIIAGILFISGAIGMEMVGGWYIENHHLNTEKLLRSNITVFVFYTIEELLEMIGVSFFIYELIRFIKKYHLSFNEVSLPSNSA